MKKSNLLVFLLGIVVGIGISIVGYKLQCRIAGKASHVGTNLNAKSKAEGVRESFASGTISTFEQDEDLQKWSANEVKFELVSEHASEGARCLKLIYPQGGSPGLGAWRTVPSDWNRFDALKFDVYNPEEEVIKFGIIIRDEISDAYSERYDGYFAFKPGMNNFELNITGLKVNNKKRMLAVDKIKELVIFLDNPVQSGILYLDNVRLDKEKVSSLGQVGLISDFEGKVDYFKWQGRGLKCEVSKEYYSQGERSLKVVFPKGGYPGLNCIIGLPKDWRNFDTLKFDFYNPQQEVIKFGIMIKDYLSDSYAQRYDGYFAFKPGMNSFEFNITGLKTNSKKRVLSMDRIEHLSIFLFKPEKKFTLYFDNIRLEKESTSGLNRMYRFDFGPESSEVWPGFIKVTDKTLYNKEKGHGWSSIDDLRADDRQYPDPLFRDWVRGSGPFNLDLPNDEYTVYMMLEDPGFWEYYQNYESREVYAEDSLALKENLDKIAFFQNYYFRHLESEDLPGEDVWTKYVNTRFTPKIFNVKVDDGQLNLRFSPAWGYACTLSSLIVYPVKAAKEAEIHIAEINKKRKSYFNTQFVESVPVTSELSFDLNQVDKEKGYILFLKNYLEEMLPSTIPSKEELVDEVRLFAVNGESEPFTIGIYPLKDLAECELVAENLTSNEGYIFSSENVDIKVTQYKLKLEGSSIYKSKGELLRYKSKIKIDKGISRQYWITVNVPENTLPGTYTGKLNFIPAQGKEQTVKLTLSVLPFQLTELDIAVGMFYFAPAYLRWYKGTNENFTQQIKEHLTDLKAHNMNSLAIDIAPKITKVHDDGSVVLDFNDLDEFMHLYKLSGFTKPIVGYGMSVLVNQAKQHSGRSNLLFSEILKNAYKSIEKHAQEVYGLEIIFCLADEISNVTGEGIDYGVKLAQIARGVPRIKTTAMLNNDKDEPIFPYLDISTINSGMKISQGLIDRIRDSNSDLWFYNIGKNRFSFGYYLAKTKAKGRLQWNYQLPAVDPYFDLDGRESDYCASYPSLEGPINSVWFERIREGIDDYKYILTLSNFIQEAKQSNNQEIMLKAKYSEEVIAGILSQISVEINDNQWPVNKYNEERKKIAEQIVILKKALDLKELVEN